MTRNDEPSRSPRLRATTILGIKRGNECVLAGDGQVSLGQTVVKGSAQKIRKLADGRVLTGFAGAGADAFTLLERLERKIEEYPQSLARAAVELAKDWRTDRYLRRLEAMLIALDREHLLLVSGSGDVIIPDDGVVAVGSGGNYALSAARALLEHSELSAVDIARAAMKVAGDICVYTNHHLQVETLSA